MEHVASKNHFYVIKMQENATVLFWIAGKFSLNSKRLKNVAIEIT